MKNEITIGLSFLVIVFIMLIWSSVDGCNAKAKKIEYDRLSRDRFYGIQRDGRTINQPVGSLISSQMQACYMCVRTNLGDYLLRTASWSEKIEEPCYITEYNGDQYLCSGSNEKCYYIVLKFEGGVQ
jgi:hypothetical protein